MYEVRFIRTDTAIDESYYYHRESEAQQHFGLFNDADADMYFAIQIYNGDILIDQNILGYSDDEIQALAEVATRDQFDTCLALLHMAQSMNGSMQEMLISLRLKVVSIEYDRYEAFFNLICT